MSRLGVFVACLVVALVAAETVAVETQEQTEGFWDTIVDLAGAALNAVNRIPVTPRPPAPPSTGTNGRPNAPSPPPDSPALSTQACAGGSHVLTGKSGSFTWNNFNNPQSIGRTTYKSNLNKCYIVKPPTLAANEEVELTFARVDIASVDKLMVFDEATQKVVKSVRDTEGTFRSKKGFTLIFQTNNEKKTKKGFLVSFGVRKTTPPSTGGSSGGGSSTGPFSVSIERAKNAKAHRTEYFDDTGALHARRGLPIEFVTVNGKIEAATLQAAGGPAVTICGGQKDTTYDSTCTPTATGFTLTFAVNAPIGAYSIVASSSGNRRALAVKLFLMFNPFSDKDSTYMRPADAQSFVVANSGYVYQASYAKKWNFDQNTPNAVLTAFNGVAQLPVNDRRSPLKVMRRISLDVGNNVLWGRWDGDYDDGEQPTSWSSSSAIFDKFQKSKSQVKYGQCWVFSALVVSYGRALGLPTRSITNLDSAHERGPNFDGICETHYKKTADNMYVKDERRNVDSVWNFHVWNEGFTGGKWYAFDATPQEPSGPKKEYQCGPYEISHLFAATKAKQAGPEITAAVNRAPSYQWDSNPTYDGRYDGPFIHGETNCEVVNMFEGKPINFRNSPARDACKIGARTLTWSGVSNTAQNVAGCYKDDSKCAGYATCPRTSSEAPALLEVQAEAKVSALNRLSIGMRSLLDAVIQVDPETAEEHASWLMMLEREGVVTGVSELGGTSKDDVTLPPASLPLTPGLTNIPVGVKNLGPGRHKIRVQVEATTYNGKCFNQPSDRRNEGSEEIAPTCGSIAYSKTIEIETPQFQHLVPVAALIPFMHRSLSFRFTLSAATFTYDNLITLTPPPLAVAPSTLAVGKFGTVSVTVTNPLPVSITGGTVFVRIAGSTKTAKASVRPIAPGGQVTVTVRGVSVDQAPEANKQASITADFISPSISLTGNGKATVTPRVSKLVPVVAASTKKGIKVYGSGAGAGAPPAPQAAPASPVDPKVSPVLSKVEDLLGPL